MAGRLPMREGKKIFVLAGEPSGDRIGGALLKRLHLKFPNLDISGIGGQDMIAQGLSPLYPMSDLSVMGFADVIKRLPLLLFRLRQTVRFILKDKPDVVVLIDAQVFSSEIAKKLRKGGFEGKIILYVAPSVWAWKPERAKTLKGVFDEILAVLPFEPDVMRRLDGPLTTYVGHPALEKFVFHPHVPNEGLIAMFPGSRQGELKRHLPLMRQLAMRLSTHPAVTGFVMPVLPHAKQWVQDEVRTWTIKPKVISTPGERAEALDNTILALATAGTVTLELALTGVPMLGTYVPDKRLMYHYEKAGRPMVALPNIVLQQRIVPEIPPSKHMARDIWAEATRLIEDRNARHLQIEAFKTMRALMTEGAHGDGIQDAAERIASWINS